MEKQLICPEECPCRKKDSENKSQENSEIKKVSIRFVIKDLFHNLPCIEFLLCVVFCFILFFTSLFANNYSIENYDISAMISPLLGFSIAALTIIFSLTDSTKNKLRRKIEWNGKEEVPYDALCAIFTINALLCGFVLLLYYFKVNCSFAPWLSLIVNAVLEILTFFCIIWTMNSILHLFAVRTTK